MYADFIDQNETYLKDSYPYLNIDNLVEKAFSYVILSFYDVFSQYNQILIWVEN